MWGFGKNSAAKSEAARDDEAQEINKELRGLFQAVERECESHLLWVAAFKDDLWEKAEEANDFQTVITAFCGAVDGTEEHANKMFKPYGEQIEQIGIPGLAAHLKVRRLQHLIQLRLYFEHKLKIMLINTSVDRETWRQKISEILTPQLGKSI